MLKVLVVEDEELIRRGIVLAVDWAALDCVVVAEAVWAVLRRDAVPGGAVVISRLNEAISGAEGEEDHVLLSPTQNIQIPTGKIAVPGSITWEEA